MQRDRFFAVSFFAIVGFVLIVARGSAAEPPRIADLLKVKFKRVQGDAHGGAVLDPGPSGSWYDEYVWGPSVLFDGTTYRMWFTGGHRTNDPSVPYGVCERIGMAVSNDGINWNLANDGQPVLDLERSGRTDLKSVSHPFVLRVGDNYMMWYGMIDGTTAADLSYGGWFRGVRVERIGCSVSTDGINWKPATSQEVVLDIGPHGSVDSIQATGMHVVEKNGHFTMWYGTFNGNHRIAVATSPDGIKWTKGNSGQPVSGLNGTTHLGPSVYNDGDKYYMLYNTKQSPFPKRYTTYAATSDDGIHWTPAYGNKALLDTPPEGNFAYISQPGAHPSLNHSVHPTKFLVRDGRIWVYYSAETDAPRKRQRIGVMEVVWGTSS